MRNDTVREYVLVSPGDSKMSILFTQDAPEKFKEDFRQEFENAVITHDLRIRMKQFERYWQHRYNGS